MEQEGKTFRVAEWTIENFTCWSLQLHGNCIESAVPFLTDVKFILHPRGVGGVDDRMTARVCFSFHSTSSGDLSFVSSDGSILCAQRVNTEMDGPLDVELPPGPRFEEAMSRIRKNEPYHGDRLTLLYKAESARDHTEKMHTVIDVFDTTLKLDADVVGCGREISLIDYSTSKNHDRLYLKSVSNGFETELELVPSIFKDKKCLVQSTVSLMKKDGEIEVCKDTERMCSDENPWMITEPLNTREMLRKGITLLLRLKIISGVTSTQCFHKLFYAKGSSIVSNASSSKKKESSKSLDFVTANKTGDSVTILTRDFMFLYQDQDFSDITLKCGNVTFPVHKNILSARSPVFKTMLSTDMKETASGQVDIGDLDPSTLSRFLTYLYTGAVEEELEGEAALKLYYAADKYQVPSLKGECRDFLCEKVSVSNVCDILSLADKHQDHWLTAVSNDFILNNFNEVLSSKEWDAFKGREPLLAVNTVTSFAQKNYLGKI